MEYGLDCMISQKYMKLDPLFRKNALYMMTFSMEYAYSEDYILVIVS